MRLKQARYLIKIPLPAMVAAFMLLFTSCKIYKQDIMLKTDNQQQTAQQVQAAASDYTKNYRIAKNDWIEVLVYTNKGELIIDPTSELSRAIGTTANTNSNYGPVGINSSSNKGKYLVEATGLVNLPMVGRVKLDSLSYRQADSILSKKYSFYYEDAYVVTRTANRRVVVISGKTSQNTAGGAAIDTRVVYLTNENTNIFEVLAEVGGLPIYSNAKNIKIVRGNLNNPQVLVLDLSTVESMKKSDLKVYPNDIIYIEPARRNLVEGAREFYPFFTFFTSIVAITSLILNARR